MIRIHSVLDSLCRDSYMTDLSRVPLKKIVVKSGNVGEEKSEKVWTFI